MEVSISLNFESKYSIEPFVGAFALMFIMFFTYIVLSLSLFGLIIFLIIAIIYILSLGPTNKKPEYSLYALMIITLFFPRGYNYDDTTFIINRQFGLYPFVLMQFIAGFTVLLHIINKKYNIISNSKLRNYIVFLGLMLIVSFLIELVRQLFGGFYNELVNEDSVTFYIDIIVATTFFFGCVLFLREKRKIDIILYIIIISGIELFIEVFLYMILKLDLPRAQNVIGFEGRFESLIFKSFTTLVYVSFTAIGATLFLYRSKRKLIYLILTFIVSLPIIFTLQRAAMISGFSVIIVYISLVTQKKTVKISILLLLLLSLLISFDFLANFILKNNIMFIAENRPYIFNPESYSGSGLQRLGLAIRGIELFFAYFPFGVGADYTRLMDLMASSKLPAFFMDIMSGVTDSRITSGYLNMLTGQYMTDTHNYYAMFLAAYGLFGFIILIILIKQYFKQFIFLWNYHLTKIENMGSYLILLKIFAVSVLFGFFVHFWFQTLVIYPIFFFLIFIIFVENEIMS